MSRFVFTLVVTAAVVAASACAASAETYEVSDLAELATLLSEKANPGDVIEIQPGTYYLTERKIAVLRSGTSEAPIIITGVVADGKRPVIDASRHNVVRGIFYVEQEVHDVIIENLDLCNAAGAGNAGDEYTNNAAAVYFIGSNITVRNCRSTGNENGFFSTHESDYILIENCEVDHNGTQYKGEHNRTHNFYFNSKHQIVKGCYIHDSTEGENFKSRGGNVIFAYNWVDEDNIYSVAEDSGGEMNTLWLGNVVMKRTYEGPGQGRLLGIGDGTGVAGGTLVVLNNTFITIFPRDLHLFTEWSSTANAVLINNVFAGPGEVFLEKHGNGSVTGANNWIASAAADVPEELGESTRGDNPGFVDMRACDFHLMPASPLVDAGAPQEKYAAALKIVLDNATTGTTASASLTYMKAFEDVSGPCPLFEPGRKGAKVTERKVMGAVDIGAYELTLPAE